MNRAIQATAATPPTEAPITTPSFDPPPELVLFTIVGGGGGGERGDRVG